MVNLFWFLRKEAMYNIVLILLLLYKYYDLDFTLNLKIDFIVRLIHTKTCIRKKYFQFDYSYQCLLINYFFTLILIVKFIAFSTLVG
jgi:hypothetical protein